MRCLFVFLVALLLGEPASLASACRSGDGIARSIVCYSGGKVIYEGESDPACQFYLGSQDDHVLFVEAKTHRIVRVGGNCIVSWAPASIEAPAAHGKAR